MTTTTADDPIDVADHASGNSVYAALGRTMTRSLALYFSRPVRLFRPVKGATDRDL
jgi:hypothetical protein